MTEGEKVEPDDLLTLIVDPETDEEKELLAGT